MNHAHPSPRRLRAAAQRPALLLGAALVLGLGATGCRRCGGEGAPPDAGATPDASATATPGTNGTITGIDLRSAMILIFPEFRGARVHGARAWVERTLVSSTPLGPIEPLLSGPAQQKGFKDLSVGPDGALHAKNLLFELTAKEVARDRLEETLSIRLSPEEVQKIFTAPTAMGSEQLQFMLPKPPGLKVERDVLQLELAYDGKPERTNFLVRQLVEGLVGIGWKPDAALDWPAHGADGGLGELPLKTTVTIRRQDTGGAIAVTRNAGEVYILYTQPLELSGR